MRATNDLLSTYQHIIDQVTLVPGSKSIYDVTVNGDLVYSKFATGRHAHDGEILDIFRTLVGPGVQVYGAE